MEEEQVQDYNYKNDLLEVKENIEKNNQTLNDIKIFFEEEKKENELKEKKEIELKLKEEKQIKLEDEKSSKDLQEFYSNIELISENTDTEITTQLLTDVSTLMQVNIMCSGLLIGIVCISLLAKFFNRG